MPTSSAAAERSWSIYTFIHSKYRNKLLSDRAMKLLFVYNCRLARNTTPDAVYDQSTFEDQVQRRKVVMKASLSSAVMLSAGSPSTCAFSSVDVAARARAPLHPSTLITASTTKVLSRQPVFPVLLYLPLA